MATTKLHVKKGDQVEVLSGKDKGVTGEVIRAIPEKGRVVVQGVAMVKKAMRPTPSNPQGGILEREAAIDASNVMLICPSCGKRTRVGHGKNAEGKKVRICKKCGAEF
jgi:large subunit ribosomal protein L24